MKHLSPLFLLLLFTFTLSCTARESNEEAEEPMEEMEEAVEEEAQEGPLSPARQAEGFIGSTGITMNYGSPSIRGREIWGGLVPYGEVWRTGANEATTISFDKDVMIEGERLPAGTYSIYSIPGEDLWTIIFNKQTGQWGTEYDEAQDALRVEVEPEEVEETVEAMRFDIEDDQIVLRWENLAVPVEILEAG